MITRTELLAILYNKLLVVVGSPYILRAGYKYHDCRLDLVVLLNHKPHVIIKVKAYRTDKLPVTNTKLLGKYRKYCKYVLLAVRLQDLDGIVNRVRLLCKK
jgi:hypothetical protein